MVRQVQCPHSHCHCKDRTAHVIPSTPLMLCHHYSQHHFKSTIQTRNDTHTSQVFPQVHSFYDTIQIPLTLLALQSTVKTGYDSCCIIIYSKNHLRYKTVINQHDNNDKTQTHTVNPTLGFALLFQVEELLCYIYFVRQFESIDVFLTLQTWRLMEAVISRQKGSKSNDEKKKRKKAVIFSYLQSGRVRRWVSGAKGLRRTAQMQEVSKKSSRGVNSTDTQASNFISNASFDRQPVELSEHWCGMYTGRLCLDSVQEGCTVVCSSKESDQGKENDIVQSGTKYKVLQVK